MAVETDRGSIECEYFVNCAGQVNLRVGLCDTNGEASPSGNLDRGSNEGKPLEAFRNLFFISALIQHKSLPDSHLHYTNR